MKRSKISEILDLPLNKIMSMSRSDLAKTVSKLASASNKRLVRLQKQDITTPASEYILKHGGKFSVAGKNVAQLREEFQRAKGFLESKTATVRGYKKWSAEMAKTLFKNTGINYDDLSEDKKRIFWKAYSKLEELDYANVHDKHYRTSVNEIYDAVKGGLTEDDIESFATKLNDQIYEERTKELFSGLQNPFTSVNKNK